MPERRRNPPRRRRRRDVPDDRRSADRRAADRRRFERVAAEILIEVETSGQRTYRRTANIGLGGVGFHAPIPFRLGSTVQVTLRLAGGNLRVTGEVVGVDDGGRGTRVRFSDLDLKSRNQLQDHLKLFDAPTRVGLPPERREVPYAEGGQVREGLLLVAPRFGGQEFRLRSTDKVIGRDRRSADFVVEHPTVSRRHAHLYLQDGRHVITDLSSLNGLHFRNRPVHSLVLRDGMFFRVGQVELQYLVTRTVPAAKDK